MNFLLLDPTSVGLRIRFGRFLEGIPLKIRSIALLVLLLVPPVVLGLILDFNPGPSKDLEVSNRNTARFSILPKFEASGTFREGRAPVKQEEQWGYVNPRGEWVVRPRFQAARSFREGRAAVRTSDGWGFIDEEGNWLVFPQYRRARSFYEGRAAVKNDSGWTFVTPDGTPITSSRYDWVDRFRNGRAVVSTGEAKMYVDRSGGRVGDSAYRDAGAFGQGVAPVHNGEGWAFVDRAGNRAVPARYEWASTPRMGYARVLRDGDWFFLEVETGETEPVPGSFVGQRGAGGFTPYREDDQIGYIDNNFDPAIDPRFDQGLGFRDGLAPVKKGGLWGYVNSSGKWVIRPKFNAAGPFSEGFAPVKVGSKWGYISHPNRSASADVHESTYWVDTGVASVEPSQLNESLVEDFPTWRYRPRDRYVRVLGTARDHWTRDPFVPESNFGNPNAKYEVTRYPYEQPTYLQMEAAEQFFWRSLRVARSENWFSTRIGLRKGFGLDGKGGVDSHYFKEQHMLDQRLLVPEHPESLIYYGEDLAASMLGGMMFYHTEPEGAAPQIGGPLTPWHYHVFDDPVCHEGVMVRPFDEECEDGEVRDRSPEMIHTWFIDHPRGSFATATDLVEDRDNVFNLAFDPGF